MNPSNKGWAAGLVAVAMLSGGVAAGAQSTLPEELLASFSHGSADRFYLTAQSDADDIQVSLSFRNRDTREVRLKWKFTGSGGLYTQDVQSVTVGYRPTAVCRRAGKDNTFYVAGWLERSTTPVAIVEEWVIETPIAIATAIPAGGSVPDSTLTFPIITKTQFLPQVAGPIHDMICNGLGNELWLLVKDNETRIVRMDLATTQVTEFVNSAMRELGVLATHNSLWADMNQEHGFVIWSERRRKWQLGSAFQPPYQVLVYEDANLDGVIDAVQSMAFSSFVSTYVPPGWISRYEVP